MTPARLLTGSTSVAVAFPEDADSRTFITGLDLTARELAVYASRPTAPRKTRFRLRDSRLGRTGFSPAGLLHEVSVTCSDHGILLVRACLAHREDGKYGSVRDRPNADRSGPIDLSDPIPIFPPSCDLLHQPCMGRCSAASGSELQTHDDEAERARRRSQLHIVRGHHRSSPLACPQSAAVER